MQNYINDFIRLKEARGLSKKNIANMRTNIEGFCQVIAKPTDIKEQVIIEYFHAVQITKWSSSTKTRKMASIKSFCEYLISINKVILNEKCLHYHVQKTSPEQKHIWSETELDLILTKLMTKKYARLRAIIELAYSCGLRLREIVQADLFDLNLDEKTLLVKESKGSDRILPVTEKAIIAILDYIEMRKKIKVKTTALFINNKGTRINQNDVQASLFRLTERLGIAEQLTIHGIRNSIATALLRRGMDFVLISKFLGHSHLTTSTIYTRVICNDLKAMIDDLHPRNFMGD